MNKTFDTKTSRKLFDKSKQYLVGGVASSMHRSEWEEYPIFFTHGVDAHLYDVDENEYIDYLGGMGPEILGFTPPSVTRAVIEQISRGTQFAAPTELLAIVSQKLVDDIPCADKVIYETTGTEAVMFSLRLARAFSGKEKFIRFEGHYHGWADELMVSFSSNSLKMMGPRNKPWKTLGSAGQREGAISDVIVLPWNDLELLRKVIKNQGGEIAAIITEPIMINCDVVMPQPGFLEGLRDISNEYEIPLIFDEVITGFRLALGGAQEYFNVVPDLSTFAKAVAAGYPLAGVAGKKQYMESGAVPLGTFNGNPLSITACYETLKVLEQPQVYNHINHITHRITEGINSLAKSRGIILQCDHAASVWWLQFGISQPLTEYRDTFKIDRTMYQQFYKLGQERGLRLHPVRGRFYTSAAHTENDVDRTLEIVDEVFSLMAKA